MNTIPHELGRLIAAHLPIDTHLVGIATASNTQFTQLILFNDSFARTHLVTCLTSSSMLALSGDVWPLLPFSYKCAAYEQLIQDSKYCHSNQFTPFPLSNAQSILLACRLMNGTCIDQHAYALRLIDCLCSNAHSDPLRLTRTHPNTIPDCFTSTNITLFLERATQFGYMSLVRWLLEDGRADPTVNDGAPLRNACALGDTALVHLLLQDPRVYVNQCSNERRPAICEATRHGHCHIVKMLLADPRTDLNLPSWSSVLVQAVHSGRVDVVELLDDPRGCGSD
ncbi:hypothetical protein BJ741DRAFT_294271 [Chytriomyces cf. hyalinus JEL632]|nr:hypothetical protein BJ741DRAFT_294271 [Chytriomyces cf. hyalinus JEL632]